MFLEIKFNGGVGNQMFQYATGRALCIKNKIRFLLLNTDSYRNESLNRTFSLQHLQVRGSVPKNNFVKKIFRQRTKLNNIATFLMLYKNIREEKFVLQQIENKTGFFSSLNGFWQSPFYFNNIRNQLLKEFTPKKVDSYPEWLQKENTVAIHVRRTDYLNENRYGSIGTGYYEKALGIIKEKIKDPFPVLFSDDIEWCKIHFANQDILFFEEKNWSKDYLQLHLMSRCHHQVIANSSFSWWAAWLNENPGKVVIRPANPFNEKSLLYEAHYPEEWIAINN